VLGGGGRGGYNGFCRLKTVIEEVWNAAGFKPQP